MRTENWGRRSSPDRGDVRRPGPRGEGTGDVAVPRRGGRDVRRCCQRRRVRTSVEVGPERRPSFAGQPRATKQRRPPQLPCSRLGPTTLANTTLPRRIRARPWLTELSGPDRPPHLRSVYRRKGALVRGSEPSRARGPGAGGGSGW